MAAIDTLHETRNGASSLPRRFSPVTWSVLPLLDFGFYETSFASSVISVLPAKSREMGQPAFASCAALSKAA
jgi:hypothetical protein